MARDSLERGRWSHKVANLTCRRVTGYEDGRDATEEHYRTASAYLGLDVKQNSRIGGLNRVIYTKMFTGRVPDTGPGRRQTRQRTAGEIKAIHERVKTYNPTPSMFSVESAD